MDAAEVRELLADRPELETALEAILAVDRDQETWTFADVPVDSGQFGELVGEGVVEKVDGAYRLDDPDVVADILDEDDATESLAEPEPERARPSFPRPGIDVDRRAWLAVTGALGLLLVARAFPFPAVFRNGDVVLSSNDPYYYRYWVEELTRQAGGLLDVGVLGELPGAVAKGEPLYVATMWVVSGLLGGSTTAIGWVLAWYPVASALLTGLLLYLLAVHLTGDRRVGLATILLLAIVPGHAFRTSLGFADHHAFDYVWLAVIAWALVVLAMREGEESPWGMIVALGVGVAGQTLAWEAGPLLLVPVGLSIVAVAVAHVRTERSPLTVLWPVLAALALAAVLTVLAHLAFGWHTTQVVAAPALLLAGGLGVTGVAEVGRRQGASVRAVGGGIAGLGVLGLAGLRFLLPSFWHRLAGEMGRLIGRSGTIAETNSLLSGDSLGFLLLFGLALFLALPFMAWAVWKGRVDGPAWLVPALFGWYFLLLSAFQVRFAGQLGLFVAVFAGLGFVWLAGWTEVIEPARPFRDGAFDPRLGVPSARQVGALVFVFLIVGWAGIVQVPVKTSQVTIEDGAYRTASWIEDYSDQLGLTYPDNYVFSQWGRTRLYNYFVNGESQSYGYSQSNYGPFVFATNESRWYDRIRNRVGFVVTTDLSAEPETMQYRLHRAFGSRQDGVAGLAHFRTVYVSPDGAYRTAAVVPGATIRGQGAPNATVRLSAPVTVPGRDFTYRRQAVANATGAYAVVVPYPGTYEVGDRSVEVSAEAVRTGAVVSAGA